MYLITVFDIPLESNKNTVDKSKNMNNYIKILNINFLLLI